MGEVIEKQKSYPLSRDVEVKESTGYRYIHYGDIHKQVADIITRDDQLPCIKEGEYIPLNQGDLVLADASEDYTGIAEPSVVLHDPKDKIIAGLHTIALRPQGTDSIYLYYLFHTEKFKKYGSHVGTGLKVFGITFNNLSLFETKMPAIKEQTAIGTFFYTLDTTITLQKRKLDSLKQLKMGYLQQMFPQEGEGEPRVRFAGFMGEWEKRKLKDVANVYDGTHQTPNYTDKGVMFLSVEDINSLTSNKFISEADFLKEFKISPEYGDVLMTRIGDIGTANVVRTEEKIAYYVSLALLKPQKLNSDFLATLIHSSLVQKEIWKKTLHVAFPKKINKGEIENIRLHLPEKAEQIVIGNFFHTLDKQITTQQTKLEKLKQLKAAYLQKMFI